MMRLIPPPDNSLYAPKGRRRVPVPRDLAEHRPIVPYDDGSEFAGQLDLVHRAAAVLIRDPLRDLALAVRALTYEQVWQNRTQRSRDHHGAWSMSAVLIGRSRSGA